MTKLPRHAFFARTAAAPAPFPSRSAAAAAASLLTKTRRGAQLRAHRAHTLASPSSEYAAAPASSTPHAAANSALPGAEATPLPQPTQPSSSSLAGPSISEAASTTTSAAAWSGADSSFPPGPSSNGASAASVTSAAAATTHTSRSGQLHPNHPHNAIVYGPELPPSWLSSGGVLGATEASSALPSDAAGSSSGGGAARVQATARHLSSVSTAASLTAIRAMAAASSLNLASQRYYSATRSGGVPSTASTHASGSASLLSAAASTASALSAAAARNAALLHSSHPGVGLPAYIFPPHRLSYHHNHWRQQQQQRRNLSLSRSGTVNDAHARAVSPPYYLEPSSSSLRLSAFTLTSNSPSAPDAVTASASTAPPSESSRTPVPSGASASGSRTIWTGQRPDDDAALPVELDVLADEHAASLVHQMDALDRHTSVLSDTAVDLEATQPIRFGSSAALGRSANHSSPQQASPPTRHHHLAARRALRHVLRADDHGQGQMMVGAPCRASHLPLPSTGLMLGPKPLSFSSSSSGSSSSVSPSTSGSPSPSLPPPFGDASPSSSQQSLTWSSSSGGGGGVGASPATAARFRLAPSTSSHNALVGQGGGSGNSTPLSSSPPSSTSSNALAELMLLGKASAVASASGSGGAAAAASSLVARLSASSALAGSGDADQGPGLPPLWARAFLMPRNRKVNFTFEHGAYGIPKRHPWAAVRGKGDIKGKQKAVDAEAEGAAGASSTPAGLSGILAAAADFLTGSPSASAPSPPRSQQRLGSAGAASAHANANGSGRQRGLNSSIRKNGRIIQDRLGSVQVGEDAYFLRPDSLGVADGVGGWASRQGADPALFSRLLMHFCAAELARFDDATSDQLAAEGGRLLHEWETVDPVEVMHTAWERCVCASRREGILGSSTALIALLRGDELRIANLGDCVLLIIRAGELLFRSTEQQHSFNFPVQLGMMGHTTDSVSLAADRTLAREGYLQSGAKDDLDDEALEPLGTSRTRNQQASSASTGANATEAGGEEDEAEWDEPRRDAGRWSVQVQKGDIIIVGSDGLVDNLFDEDIVEEVRRFAPPPPSSSSSSGAEVEGWYDLPGDFDPQLLSEALCSRAKAVSEDSRAVSSPFQQRAMEEGLHYVGGKHDDISVVVAVVGEGAMVETEEDGEGATDIPRRDETSRWQGAMVNVS